ncbi:MAG: TRAP transporter large permease subunit [Nitrospinota bacterium]
MQWWERRGRFLNRHDDGFGRYHRCVLSMTGSGRRMASIVVDVSQRNIDLALVLTMLVAIILGMGMPSVAAYAAVSGNLLPLVSVYFKSFNTTETSLQSGGPAAWSLSLACLSAPVHIQKL